MLKIIDSIHEIKSFLENESPDVLIDFRVYFRINMAIDIDLIVRKRKIIKRKLEEKFQPLGYDLIINEIDEDEWDIPHVFDKNKETKIDFGLKRRLGIYTKDDEENQTEEAQSSDEKDETLPTVTTFYSYKGGIGRTTTLVSFATFCARVKKKKVVILDCDFEAPGFTNYFDMNTERLAKINGVLEYLLDKQFLGDNKKLNIDDYSLKVGQDYSGEGDIYVIPAGNLSNASADDTERTHRQHYLEGLARLDIASVKYLTRQFQDFISEINDQLKPDIILIDSRTGLNDIFTILSNISKVLIGFFGNNIQNRIGLEQFLDIFGNTESTKNIFLVNSIVPDVAYFNNFKKQVDNYIDHEEKFYQEDEDGEQIEKLYFKKYYVERHSTLEKLGTDFAHKEQGKDQDYDSNWVDLIDKDIFFKDFFNDLYSSIEIKRPDSSKETEESSKQNKESTKEIINYLKENKDKVDKFQLVQNILEKLKDELKPYAELNDPELEHFYFRHCMKDMFNRDKFLIKGSKGTGKTFIYQSFKNKEIIKQLQEYSGVTKDNYLFTNLISSRDEKDQESTNKYIEISQFGLRGIKENEDTDLYFQRFWMVFVWNSIFLDTNLKIDYKPFEDVQEIKNTDTTIQRFKNYIKDEDKYSKLWKDLEKLNNELEKQDKYLILLFDHLDSIVKPHEWSMGITPLIEFWRSNPFKRLLPKIFVRFDLFENLTSLTNSQILRYRTINIEWQKKELFAYFFKIVFACSKKDFLLLHYAFNNYGNDSLDFIKNLLSNSQYNQIPLEEKYLKPLVNTFFGKSANWNSKDTRNFADSYDWFYTSLVDANNHLSIRIFLFLIEKAIEVYFENRKKERYRDDRNAILNSHFYADFQVRKYAAERYFEDLAYEEGNKALLKVHKYINEVGLLKYKIPSFRKKEFYELIKKILEEYKGQEEMEDMNVERLVNLLVSNGIFKQVVRTDRNYINYHIPFLYRNYFGVSNKNREYNSYSKSRNRF